MENLWIACIPETQIEGHVDMTVEPLSRRCCAAVDVVQMIPYPVFGRT